jgi:hypothetical protein
VPIDYQRFRGPLWSVAQCAKALLKPLIPQVEVDLEILPQQFIEAAVTLKLDEVLHIVPLLADEPAPIAAVAVQNVAT